MEPPPGNWRTQILAFGLLAPLFALAWAGAGALVARDLYPELSAAGWVLLGLLPALIGSNWVGRPMRARGVTLLFALLAWAVVGARLGAPTDTLESTRAEIVLLSGIGALLCGAALDAPGRARLAGALPWLSLLLVGSALTRVLRCLDPALAGSLGNTGALSEAALPGALVGVFSFAASSGLRRWAGLAAAALYAIDVGAAPVFAGALSFTAAWAIAAWLAPHLRRPLVLAFGVCALFGGLGDFLDQLPERCPPSPTAPPAQIEAAQDIDTGELGGAAVRAAIWSTLPQVWSDHPWIGVGAGQFAAVYPPYRDARERELSNASAPGRESEVEHAHNDYLHLWTELGFPGLALWLGFVALALVHARRALSSGEGSRAAFGCALFGLAINALWRAPLTLNPVSSALFFVLAGTLTSRPSEGGPALARASRWACIALFLVFAPRALDIVEHGRALSLKPLAASARWDEWTLPGPEDVARARASAPDSAQALGLAARYAESSEGVDPVPLWEQLLALRPHRFEALVQLGRLRAASGRLDDARELWERAQSLAPEHAPLLRNLARLELDAGEAARASQYLDTLDEHGELAWEWLVGQGVRDLLSGREEQGLGLLERADAELWQLPPELLFERAQVMRTDPQEVPIALYPEALECRAHTVWAREHASAQNFDFAVRSYRQALAKSANVIPGGAPRLRLEYAAALLRAGDEARAQREIEALDASIADWSRLPGWAGNALLNAGLLIPQQP